jgi:hypothetical protein
VMVPIGHSLATTARGTADRGASTWTNGGPADIGSSRTRSCSGAAWAAEVSSTSLIGHDGRPVGGGRAEVQPAPHHGAVRPDPGGADIDPTAELLGLGAAHLGAGLCSGLMFGGSLSKTAVHGGAGARSQVFGLSAATLTPAQDAKRTAIGVVSDALGR